MTKPTWVKLSTGTWKRSKTGWESKEGSSVFGNPTPFIPPVKTVKDLITLTNWFIKQEPI